MEALGVAAPRTACVLAVDDQPAFRSALRFVVAACRALVLGGEADSGEAAIGLVAELEPDLVLMDVQMPGMGGIAATREIKRLSRRTVVLLVSATHPDELPSEATECHADGIIWKGDLRPHVLEAIWAKHARARD
jgi:DNA-binding NarL/FixJ family response regulator